MNQGWLVFVSAPHGWARLSVPGERGDGRKSGQAALPEEARPAKVTSKATPGDETNQFGEWRLLPHRGVDVATLVAIRLDREDLEIVAPHAPHFALPGVHVIGDGDGVA